MESAIREAAPKITVEADHLEQLRRYFLIGEESGRAALIPIEPLHRLWFQPRATRETWKRVLDGLGPGAFEDICRYFPRFTASRLPCSEYGGLGGLELLADAVAAFVQLGFSVEPFSRERVRAVDLTEAISGELRGRLGYTEADRVPGLSYLVETNAEYIDADEASIAEELLLPVAAPTVAGKKRPVLLVVPRPAAPYQINRAFAWELNRRYLGRLLDPQHKVVTGYQLNPPRDMSDIEALEPFHRGKEFALRTGLEARLLGAAGDIPPWTRASLPDLWGAPAARTRSKMR